MSLDKGQRLALLEAHALEDTRADFLEDGPLWSGLPTWGCRLCPFSTTSDLNYALAHVGKAHKELFSEPKETVTVKSKLVTSSGAALYLEV